MNKLLKTSQLEDTQLDGKIKETLNNTFPLPKRVANAQNEAFAKVRSMAANQKGNEAQHTLSLSTQEAAPKKNFQKIKTVLLRSLAGAGVAAAAFFCIYMTNATVCAQVPILKRIFDELGNSLNFAGDYTNLAEPVKNSGKELESITENGTTLTLSEVYCNESTLYLSLVLHSEEKIPDTYTNEYGKPVIELDASVDFDFDKEENIHWLNGGDSYLDGIMIDDNTFAGVIRFELGQYLTYTGMTGEKVPQNFRAKLSIEKIFGTKLEDTRPEMPAELRQNYEAAMEVVREYEKREDYEQFTAEQKDIEHQLFNDMWNAYYELYPDRQTYPNKYDNWILQGPWNFAFEVARNDRDIIHMDINDVNENGLGILSVTKTPVEISLEMEQNLDYFTVILDANGTLMDGNATGNHNTASISGYDTSKIDVYICDYIEYMDELKGYWWSDDYEEKAQEKTFKQLLDERCVYHREITFDE